MNQTSDLKLKGIAFRSWLRAFTTLYGEAAHGRLLTSMQTLVPELHELVRQNLVLAGGWYPIEHYVLMLEAGRLACPTVSTLHRDVSYHATLEDMRGALQFVLTLAGPRTIFKYHERIMSTYLRGDYSAKVEFPSDGHLEIILRGVFASRMGWQDQLGGIEAILTASGQNDVRVRISEGGKDGDNFCRYSVFFSREDNAEDT